MGANATMEYPLVKEELVFERRMRTTTFFESVLRSWKIIAASYSLGYLLLVLDSIYRGSSPGKLLLCTADKGLTPRRLFECYRAYSIAQLIANYQQGR